MESTESTESIKIIELETRIKALEEKLNKIFLASARLQASGAK
jgi:hypothetical protein